MKRKSFLFLTFILFFNFNFSQNSPDEFSGDPVTHFSNIKNLVSQFKGLSKINSTWLSKKSGQDLVIGQNDPGEVLTITGEYFIDGNLVIMNNGKLVLKGADLKIKGDITLLNNSELSAGNSSIKIIQEFKYEHRCNLYNNCKFELDSVNFSSNGQSWELVAFDSSQYILTNSDINDGFITTAFYGDASANISNTSLPGEFLCFANNNLQFENCDTILIWLVLNNSANVDVSLPDDSLLTKWNFEENNSNISGIPYSISVDSSRNVMWGTISGSGSTGTFRDSKIRASGILFSNPDSIEISNLSNGQSFTDEVIDVPDRYLRFVNSTVDTWNFYPVLNSNITVKNCIFGEINAMGNSTAQIINSVCDGSGGYLLAEDSASVVVYRSLISSQAITKGKGILISVLSAFSSQKVVANDNSAMALLNSTTLLAPKANNSSVIFDEQLPPVEGNINEELVINGTARMITGPLSPFKFEGYSVKYSENDKQVLLPTDGIHYTPKEDDSLAVWNTAGLPSGEYVLHLILFHNFGDSVVITSPARLNNNITEISNTDDISKINNFSLSQNYPNPFNPTTTIQYQIAKEGARIRGGGVPVRLKIYNILGQEIATLVNEKQIPGNYKVKFDGSQLASGIYIYKLQAGSFVAVKKLVLLK